MRKKTFPIFLLLFLLTIAVVYPRFGGGGGRRSGGSHSSGSHSSHRSSGSHGSSSHSSYGATTYNNDSESSSEGGSVFGFFIVIGILVLVWFLLIKPAIAIAKQNLLTDSNNFQSKIDFPIGLNAQKIEVAFREMQQAWQNQDLSQVRKWLSDGLYQKIMVQIKMMQRLGQVNELTNLQIYSTNAVNYYTFNGYQICDVEISFSVDDSFYSNKFKNQEEFYEGDEAVEYFTFIKKLDANATETDLYNENNCPNCGTVLNNKIGDICRCESCKTITNNPNFDWILCEITQEDNYSKENKLNYDETLKNLTIFDPNFSIQSLEDIGSNITMQIFDVLTGGKEIKLDRFAKPEIKERILNLKNTRFDDVLFNRLYLSEVTTESYQKTGNQLEIKLYVEGQSKRVRIANNRLEELDDDFETIRIYLTLTKAIVETQTETKDTIYSFECNNCGAPYDDTTQDTCNYCDALVLDETKNWVVCGFDMI